MKRSRRAQKAALCIPASSGWSLALSLLICTSYCLTPCHFSWAFPPPHTPTTKTPAVHLQPESLLDEFVCAAVPDNEVDVDAGVNPADGEEEKFRLEWQPQVPCVESRSVKVFVEHRVEAGNVLILSDIDDTLIASGGWSWIGRSLGGTDDRYARGSDYPGFSALLYLLGLGPHLRDSTTRNLKLYKPPLQIAVVSGRPNISVFRPDYLLPHIDAILTRGARQVTDGDDWQWKVGAENNMLSPKMLNGLNGRGELKVAFCLDAIRRKQFTEGSRLNAQTKFLFVGDTGERDPEVALALATTEPSSLLAIFLNVVRPSDDPHWRQTIYEDSEDAEEWSLAEEINLRGLPDIKGLSDVRKRLVRSIHEAALGRSRASVHEDSSEAEFIEMSLLKGGLPKDEEGTTETLFTGSQFESTLKQPQQQRGTVMDNDSQRGERDLDNYAKNRGAALVEAGEKSFEPVHFDLDSKENELNQALIFREVAEGGMLASEASADAEGDAEPLNKPVQRETQDGQRRSGLRRRFHPRVTISEALSNTKRFAIRVSDTLADAIQVVYEVHISTDDLDGPQTCNALNSRQAYAVATQVGQKLRNIYDAYDHRWKHTADGFNVAAPGIAGLSASRERKRRPPPLVFVKCKSVQLHLVNPPDAHKWRRFWSFFTESSERIDVKFIIDNDSFERARGLSTSSTGDEEGGSIILSPEELIKKPDLGTPVAPYTTTLSAAAHAYVLGLIDLIDVSVLVRKTHEALRSQGPLSRGARLPVLLDHLYDLEGLKALLFARGAPDSGPVREVSDLIDSLLVSQYAFAKRAAYTRAFPNRQNECVHDLQRSLLEIGQATSAAASKWQSGQGRLVAFGTPFAAFICEYDLELASIQFAGAAEIVGLTILLSKVVREALVAAERGRSIRAKLPTIRGSRSPTVGPTTDEGHDVDEVDKQGDTVEQCTLTHETVQRFRKFYATMCKAFASIACQLFKARLSPPVLEDLILVAESRAANRNGPIELPNFGMRIYRDEDVQEYFAHLHQRPAAQLLGFLGDPVDYALQPTMEGKGSFESWPGVDSMPRWRSIAQTIKQLLYCSLIS